MNQSPRNCRVVAIGIPVPFIDDLGYSETGDAFDKGFPKKIYVIRPWITRVVPSYFFEDFFSHWGGPEEDPTSRQRTWIEPTTGK
jgi:hypothetical protein